MEVRQIVYFLALCQELHFTRAAKRCGVAQPSLTNAIRALERELGAPLFHRKPRPRLSELGAAIRPELERALAHVEKALAQARRPPSRRRAVRALRAQLERGDLATTRGGIASAGPTAAGPLRRPEPR